MLSKDFFRPILIAHAYTDNLVDATWGYDKRIVLVISRSWYTLQHCSSYNKRQGQTLGTVSIAYVLLNPCFPGLGVNWKYLSAKQNTNCKLSDWVDLEWSLWICISTEFPAEANASCMQATHGDQTH